MNIDIACLSALLFEPWFTAAYFPFGMGIGEVAWGPKEDHKSTGCGSLSPGSPFDNSNNNANKDSYSCQAFLILTLALYTL